MHTWFVLLKLLLYLVAYTSIFVLWWYLVFHISKRVTRKNEQKKTKIYAFRAA